VSQLEVAQTVEAWATVAGIICAGIWAFFHFQRRRERYPRAVVTHSKQFFPVPAKIQELAAADVRAYVTQRQADGAANGTINREISPSVRSRADINGNAWPRTSSLIPISSSARSLRRDAHP